MERRYHPGRLNAVGNPARACKKVPDRVAADHRETSACGDEPGCRGADPSRDLVAVRQAKENQADRRHEGAVHKYLRVDEELGGTQEPERDADVDRRSFLGHEQLVETPEQERRYDQEREVEVDGALEGHVRPEPVKQAGREGGRPPSHPSPGDQEHRRGRTSEREAQQEVEGRDRSQGERDRRCQQPEQRNGRVRGEVHAEGKVDVVGEEGVETVPERERRPGKEPRHLGRVPHARSPMWGSLLAFRGRTGQYAKTARTT